MIIVNIHNQTTAFLEDISAVTFQTLAKKTKKEIKEFAVENQFTDTEVEEFIADLYQNGIIGKNENKDNKDTGDIRDNQDKEDIIAFEKEIYSYGYLFGVHIDITYDCNMRCMHCYHPFSEYKNKKVITLDEIETFIDDVYELGVFNVTLSGGEILLRKDFENIVAYITQKGMAIYLLTNATLMNEKMVAIINKYNVQKIGISLYSLDESVHDEITQSKGSCRQTKQALQMLKATDVMINVNCVLMKSNFKQYKEMIEFCEKNKFSLTLDTSMTPKLNGSREPIELSLNYEQLVKLSSDSNSDYYVENNNGLLWDKEPCQAGRVSIYCNPSGEIYPCVSFRFKLGDMKDIKEIWKNSSRLHRWQNIKLKDFKGCGKKDYCKYCIEVCAGVCQLENEDYLNGETSICLKAKAREEAYKRLHK
jgi:radical SAM protein with 4Fe4S-binding SPASM domain